MSDIKNFLDILEEYSEEEVLVEAQDSFDIELGEDLLIETGVIDVSEDGILIEGDEETLKLLAEHGLLLEETDWSKYDEPTVARIKKGVTKPVDRTDYDTPPAMRDPDQGKPGYEKRKSRIMKGLEKVNELSPKTKKSYSAAAKDDKKFNDRSIEFAKRMGKEQPHKQAEWDDEVEFLKSVNAKRDRGLKRAGVAEGEMDEAKYQGREVPLGKPMAGDVKKSKVYVKGPKGNVVKVNFGDKKMRIKKSNPKRRKSFRARHNCKNPGPRWKARYWSCRAW